MANLPKIKLPSTTATSESTSDKLSTDLDTDEKDKEGLETEDTNTELSDGEESGDNISDEGTEEDKEPSEDDANKVIISPVIPKVTVTPVNLTPPAPPVKKENTPKLVKVRLKQAHSCSIGSNKYAFEKREVREVPLNVKKVLERANLLAPL